MSDFAVILIIITLVLAILILLCIGFVYSLAKPSLTRIELKLNAIMRSLKLDPLLGLNLSERVKELANDPKRTEEAIKAHCEETGKGQAEAAQAIEAYIASR